MWYGFAATAGSEFLAGLLKELRHTVRAAATSGAIASVGTLGADFVAKVADGQRAGQIRDDLDADVLAAQIVAMRDGLLLQWGVDPDAFDVVQVMEEYVDSLVRRRPSADG